MNLLKFKEDLKAALSEAAMGQVSSTREAISQNYIPVSRGIDAVKIAQRLTESEKVIKGSFHEWRSKLPNDISHLDSTKEDNVTIAYKNRVPGEHTTKYEIGRYFHRAGHGILSEGLTPEQVKAKLRGQSANDKKHGNKFKKKSLNVSSTK